MSTNNVNLGAFRNATYVSANDDRVALDRDGVKLAPKKGGFLNAIRSFWDKLTRGSERKAENMRTVNAFRQQLRGTYGEAMDKDIDRYLYDLAASGKSLKAGMVRTITTLMEDIKEGSMPSPLGCIQKAGAKFNWNLTGSNFKSGDPGLFLNKVTMLVNSLPVGAKGSFLGAPDYFSIARTLTRDGCMKDAGTARRCLEVLAEPAFKTALGRLRDEREAIREGGANVAADRDLANKFSFIDGVEAALRDLAGDSAVRAEGDAGPEAFIDDAKTETAVQDFLRECRLPAESRSMLHFAYSQR